MPDILSNHLGRAAIVFDAANLVSEKYCKSFVDMAFQEMFDSTEYCYLPKDQLDVVQQNAVDDVIDLLKNRLMERELLDTNSDFALFFFEDVEALTKDRMDGILHFIHHLRIKLGLTSDVSSYLVASKCRRNSSLAKQNMDALVQALQAGRLDADTKVIILEQKTLDRSAEKHVRAVVRFAHIVSHDSALRNAIAPNLDDPNHAKMLWQFTMTEFNEHALEELNKELAETNRLLSSSESFPGNCLQDSIEKIRKEKGTLQGYSGVLHPGHFPIPKDAVCRCIINIDKAKDACKVLEENMQRSFAENAKIMLDKHALSEGEMRSLSEEIAGQIPLNHWGEIASQIKAKHSYVPLNYDFSINRLRWKREKLQEDVEKQIEGKNKEFEEKFPDFITEQLRNYLSDHVNGDAYVKREEALKKEIIALQSEIRQNGGQVTLQDYYLSCSNSTAKACPISGLMAFNSDLYVLLNVSTNQNFNKLPQNQAVNSNNVYCLADLKRFSIQTLMVNSYDAASYEKGAAILFQQGE